MKLLNNYIKNKDFMWFVGYFEGEGCIDFNKQRYKNNINYCIKLNISSTDLDVLRKVIKIIKCGYINSTKSYHKPLWRWYVAKQTETLPLMKAMYKYMGFRRKNRMKEAIKYMKTKSYLGIMDRMKNYNPNKYLKKNNLDKSFKNKV